MKLYKCEQCKKSFRGNHQLNRHLATHSGLKQFKCQYCSTVCSRHDILLTHIKTRHTGESRHKCEYCGKCCASNYSLQQHISIHTGTKQFKCFVCGKRFRYSQQLKDHRNRHANIRPYQCPLCDKRFVCHSELKTHLDYHSGIKRYQCDECGRKFSQHCHWRAHLRTHSGDRPYKCEKCFKTFRQSAHLLIHRSSHTGIKPYECNVCHAKFRLPHTLKCHMRRHTGEKPYKCRHCDKFFSQPTPRNHHELKAHGNEKFSCEKCEKVFPTKVQLRVHNRIHFGVKRFSCLFCDKTYFTESILFKHMRSHIREKPFYCKVCQNWCTNYHKKKACLGVAVMSEEEVPIPIPITISPPPSPLPAVEEPDCPAKKVVKKKARRNRPTAKKLNERAVKPEKSTIKSGEEDLPVPVAIPLSPLPPLPGMEDLVGILQKRKAAGVPSTQVQNESRTVPATKRFQCPVCRKIMKHQNQLNGHMKIHKESKSEKTKKQAVAPPSQEGQSQNEITPPGQKTSIDLPSVKKPHCCVICNCFFGNKGALANHQRLRCSLPQSNNQAKTTIETKADNIKSCPIPSDDRPHGAQVPSLISNEKKTDTNLVCAWKSGQKTAKKKARRRVGVFASRKRKGKKVPPPVTPSLDPGIIDDSLEDMEIEYATAEDEDLDDDDPGARIATNGLEEEETVMPDSLPEPELELRIESVRHVPEKELHTFRPFQCEHCNKMYKTTGELERHMGVHGILVPPPLVSPKEQTTTLSKKVIDDTDGVPEKRKKKKKKKIRPVEVAVLPEDNFTCPPDILEIFEYETETIPGFQEDEKKEVKNADRDAGAAAVVTLTGPPKLSPINFNKKRKKFSSEDLFPPLLVAETRENLQDNLVEKKKSPKRQYEIPETVTHSNKEPTLDKGKTTLKDGPSIKKPHRCDICYGFFGNKGALAIHQRLRCSLSQSKNQAKIQIKTKVDKSSRIPSDDCPPGKQVPPTISNEKTADTNLAIPWKSTRIKAKKRFFEAENIPAKKEDITGEHVPTATVKTLPAAVVRKKKLRCSICRRHFGNKGAFAVHQKTHSAHKKKEIPTNLDSPSQSKSLEHVSNDLEKNNPQQVEHDICPSLSSPAKSVIQILEETVENSLVEIDDEEEIEIPVPTEETPFLNDPLDTTSNPEPESSLVITAVYPQKPNLSFNDAAKRYKCPICNFVTTERILLHKHAQHAHYKKFIPLRCKVCLKSFPTQGWLDVHVSRNPSCRRGVGTTTEDTLAKISPELEIILV